VPGRRRDLPIPPSDGRGLLVVGAGSEVGAELVRLAATAGVATEVIEPAQLTDAIWSTPHLVMVDAESADQVCRAALPRRTGVLIVTTARPGAELWSAAVSIGVEEVLELPAGQAGLVDRLTDAAGGSGPLGILIAVTGGSGGAGASTLAAALAVSAARSGQQPVLLGADPWDGGIDVALGAEGVPGPRWPDLAGISGRLSSTAILDGLPQTHGVRFVSSARTHPSRVPLPALCAVVTAARRTGGPVVVDVPRGSGETARWLGGVLDLGLVVCPATVSGALAARASVAETGWTARNAGVVVRCGLGRDIHDDALATAVGLPVILALREHAALSKQRRRGEPPGPRRRNSGQLAKSCTALWKFAATRQDRAA